MKICTLLSAGLMARIVSSRFVVDDDIFAFPKYIIKYDNENFVTNYEAEKLLNELHENVSYEVLKTSSNKYLCSIPNLPSQDDDDVLLPTINQTNQTSNLNELSKTISDALENICFIENAVFWKYTYCHKKSFTQVHGKLKYDLGRPNPNEHYPELKLIKESGIWALSHVLDNGTICDLTGDPRTVEIQYVCNPESEDHKFNMNWIREYKTCHYVSQIHIPQLCQVDLFKDSSKLMNDVTCQKVVDVDNDSISKGDLVLGEVFTNHPSKINLIDYSIEKIGPSLSAGHPLSNKDPLMVLIDTSGSSDLVQRFGSCFFRSLRYGKLSPDPQSLIATDLIFEVYVYDKSGNYLTTLTVEQTVEENLSITVRENENKSYLVSNFRLREQSHEPEAQLKDGAATEPSTPEPQEVQDILEQEFLSGETSDGEDVAQDTDKQTHGEDSGSTSPQNVLEDIDSDEQLHQDQEQGNNEQELEAKEIDHDEL